METDDPSLSFDQLGEIAALIVVAVRARCAFQTTLTAAPVIAPQETPAGLTPPGSLGGNAQGGHAAHALRHGHPSFGEPP